MRIVLNNIEDSHSCWVAVMTLSRNKEMFELIADDLWVQW